MESQGLVDTDNNKVIMLLRSGTSNCKREKERERETERERDVPLGKFTYLVLFVCQVRVITGDSGLSSGVGVMSLKR